MLTTTPDDVRNDLEKAGEGDLTVDGDYEMMILVTDSDGEFWPTEKEAEVYRKCVEEVVDLGDDKTELISKPAEGYEHREAVREGEMMYAVTIVEFAITDLLTDAVSSLG